MENTTVKIICPHCGKGAHKTKGHYNRAKKVGAKLFCSHHCALQSRKIERSTEEKKAIKKAYDKEYRFRPHVEILKGLSHHLDYRENPEKYRQIRKKKYPKHLEYLRRAEYVKWKREYDQKYHDKKNYGEFWESGYVLTKLQDFLPSKEIKYNIGIRNKSQNRKRNYKQINQQIR